MSNETIYDIYWEGPFEWDEKDQHIKDRHVLYQIYGAHHLYGRDILLYIGMTSKGVNQRLKEHEKWVYEEYDKVSIRIGSLGQFTSWKDWSEGDYKEAEKSLVGQIEALLIYAHQPVYNKANKEQAKKAKGIRIFNSGFLGQLFPEISYRYFLGD